MTAFDIAAMQWREAERRVEAADPVQQVAIIRVVERIVAELRRRLGGAFTTDELVALYEQGTSWCLDLAVAVAPGAPWAWEQRLVADAAFARYLREASDYAGGRRLEPDV